MVQFLIVPEWLYISGGELHVLEGDAVTLSQSMLAVLTEYYHGRVTEYRVVEPPSAGILQSSQEPNIRLHKFSASHLKAGLVQVHFGINNMVCHDCFYIFWELALASSCYNFIEGKERILCVLDHASS